MHKDGIVQRNEEIDPACSEVVTGVAIGAMTGAIGAIREMIAATAVLAPDYCGDSSMRGPTSRNEEFRRCRRRRDFMDR